MVETEKHNVYPLVYLLIQLTLILSVATASVERAFSAMSYIKNKLRNRMGDQWLNDTLVVYIERDMTDRLNTKCVIQHFQNKKFNISRIRNRDAVRCKCKQRFYII
ncbi:hypothetical protein LINPERHAP2_LOCUS3832 [Linum perenne]